LSKSGNDNLEAAARFLSRQHVKFYFEMTYKNVNLSLRGEGACPFLQAEGRLITRSSITPESIQTRFTQKRSGHFSTHVKG